jgi:hypothetical protein
MAPNLSSQGVSASPPACFTLAIDANNPACFEHINKIKLLFSEKTFLNKQNFEKILF